MTTPFVGQRFIHEGATLEVTSVTPILTPYRRAGQDTKIEGWSLGVRVVPAYHPLNLEGPALQNIPVRTKLGDKVRAVFAEALQERGSFMSNLDFNAIERRVYAAMEEAFAERTAAPKKGAAPKDTVIFALYGNPPPGTPLHACAAFHSHLDQCAQCREHPMGLCPVGAELLTLEKP